MVAKDIKLALRYAIKDFFGGLFSFVRAVLLICITIFIFIGPVVIVESVYGEEAGPIFAIAYMIFLAFSFSFLFTFYNNYSSIKAFRENNKGRQDKDGNFF